MFYSIMKIILRRDNDNVKFEFQFHRYHRHHHHLNQDQHDEWCGAVCVEHHHATERACRRGQLAHNWRAAGVRHRRHRPRLGHSHLHLAQVKDRRGQQVRDALGSIGRQ